jgi:hypothetical protein
MHVWSTPIKWPESYHSARNGPRVSAWDVWPLSERDTGKGLRRSPVEMEWLSLAGAKGGRSRRVTSTDNHSLNPTGLSGTWHG